MPISLRQSAHNAVHRGGPRTVTATFAEVTSSSSLVLVEASASAWDDTPTLTLNQTGYTLLTEQVKDHLKVTVWYREAAPAITSVAVTTSVDQSLQVRALEYTGIRSTAALDRLTVLTGNSTSMDTGTTAATTQADELVYGTLVNLYESPAQSGFTGGLTKLYETVSPTAGDDDHDRTRMTVHQRITTVTGTQRLTGTLSTSREWVGVLATFRGGSTGPVALVATGDTATIEIGGEATLSVFGPLVATGDTATIEIGGEASMHPFNYQYLLDGRLLVGAGTPYPVAEIEGLEGWEVRTSDDDLPRGDGAIRGIDLQSSRQVLFTLGMGTGDRTQTEVLLRNLYRVLIPRRDTDMELVWRHPDQPVKMLRCRPITNIRGMDQLRLLFQDQRVALLASDPRHYAPTATVVSVPVSSATGDPTLVQVVNSGDAPAYPVIRVERVSTVTDTVTGIELVNESTDATFAVTVPLLAGSVLVGDMEAKVLTAPRSTITLNGASVYGSWQLPRKLFYLGASPEVSVGVNELYLRTTPAGAAVTATVSYRNSWQG